MKLVNAICIAVLFCFTAPTTAGAAMLGPYSGTVFDATTGTPIEGASVLFYWRKIVLQPFGSSSDLIDAKLITTNVAGKYELPISLVMAALLDSTHVIIYQPGYQAYIKLLWHDNQYAKPDLEFRDTGNIVKLERIPPDFDHKAHFNRIEEALRLLERSDYSEKRDVSWEGIVKSGLRMPLEREQFLRRIEWEQRRPGKEGRL